MARTVGFCGDIGWEKQNVLADFDQEIFKVSFNFKKAVFKLFNHLVRRRKYFMASLTTQQTL